MRPEDIIELLRARPFRPFRVRLSDGQQFEVRHPELAMVGRSQIIIGTPDAQGPEGTFERTVNCALLHVTTTEVIDGAAPAGSTGADRD